MEISVCPWAPVLAGNSPSPIFLMRSASLKAGRHSKLFRYWTRSAYYIEDDAGRSTYLLVTYSQAN